MGWGQLDTYTTSSWTAHSIFLLGQAVAFIKTGSRCIVRAKASSGSSDRPHSVHGATPCLPGLRGGIPSQSCSCSCISLLSQGRSPQGFKVAENGPPEPPESPQKSCMPASSLRSFYSRFSYHPVFSRKCETGGRHSFDTVSFCTKWRKQGRPPRPITFFFFRISFPPVANRMDDGWAGSLFAG